jgi:hypothetical protein
LKKCLIKFFLYTLALSFCLIILGAAPSDSEKAKTLASFTKIDDFPMYVMDYYGDYAFDEYLK